MKHILCHIFTNIFPLNQHVYLSLVTDKHTLTLDKDCANKPTIIVGFYTKLYKQKCRSFDNTAQFSFDQNLPEDISLPES